MKIQQLMFGAVLLSGCSGSVDVGPGVGGSGAPGGNAGAPASSGTGGPACTDETPLPTWPSPTDCVAASDLPIVGTWHGYVENGQSPWDDITLVIKGASISGGVCGTIAIGSGTLPPPATDPNLGYPLPEPPDGYEHLASFIAGYPLTLLKGTSDGTRVTFRYADTESRRSWCQLQTSYGGADPNVCGCIPSPWGATNSPGNCVLSYPDHSLHPISCAKEMLCGMAFVCKCNATGCDSSMDSTGSFDLRFTADGAQGSTSGVSAAPSRPGTAYFTRVP